MTLFFVFGPLGAYVAAQKNRPKTEGFLLGFFFGPFGPIYEGMLPDCESWREKAARSQRAREGEY